MPLPRVVLYCHTSSSPAGSCTIGGRSSRLLIKVNMVAFAPMPRARERTATIVSPGDFPSARIPYRRSCHRVSMEGIDDFGEHLFGLQPITSHALAFSSADHRPHS